MSENKYSDLSNEYFDKVLEDHMEYRRKKYEAEIKLTEGDRMLFKKLITEKCNRDQEFKQRVENQEKYLNL